MILVALVLSGFAAAIVAPFLCRVLGRSAGWVIAILPAAIAAYLAGLLPQVIAGNAVIVSFPWVPTFGINVSFHVDGLGLLFALLISGIGALVVIYSGGYLKGNPNLGRFYSWLLMFMASMLGVALSDNLILLFVFWELTSFSSYMLIGFEHDREAARKSALQALLVTGIGGLAMLAGLLLLGMSGGSLDFTALMAQSETVRSSALYLPALLLILAGAFTKSAQFPFHFWLPNAMEAPTPVSAYLHSATMVKAGVYLLARLSPLLGGTDVWVVTVSSFGAATMLVGAYLAFVQTDLKRILAYSTVSSLGTLTLLIGLGTPHAQEAAMVYLLGHALYKGTLFLVAGAVDHGAGTRDVTRLSGLARAMPITTAAAGLAALSIAGLPPLFGFIAKESAYEAGHPFGIWLIAALFLAGLSNVFVGGVAGIGPFFLRSAPAAKNPGRGQAESATAPGQDHAHEVPSSMWLGPVVLAGLGLVLGLAPSLASETVLSAAASSVVGHPVKLDLALWHGFSPTLVLSAFTLLVGTVLFVMQRPLRNRFQQWTWRWGPARAYDLLIDAMMALAHGQTRFLQSGYLRRYLLTIVVTSAGLAAYTLLSQWKLEWPGEVSGVRFYDLSLAALIVVGALLAVTLRSRLGAVAAMGASGIGISLIYLSFGAPDLAMTQVLIESLTVILFVLAFYHLPTYVKVSTPAARLRDALVALFTGGLFTVLILSALTVQLQPSIASYFNENALHLAHGRNIVNVILVDFRGFDTMGEITVLGLSAIGAYALLARRKEGAK